MTQRIIFILFILGTFSGRAQENEDFKLGLALPIFTKTNKSVTISSGPIFSIEKPIPINLFSDNRFGINPGLAYFKFFENEQPKELGTGITKDMNHVSFNTFVKTFVNFNINKVTNSYFYIGAITGFHIATSSKGTVEVYQNENLVPELSRDVNESGNGFFNSSYYGFLIGFHPKSETKSIVTPSFELSYLPNFVSVKDNHEQAIQISIFLGINPKKKATRKE